VIASARPCPPEPPPNLHGKEGSTVRVRQRALQKPCTRPPFWSRRFARVPACGGYGAVYGAFRSASASPRRSGSLSLGGGATAGDEVWMCRHGVSGHRLLATDSRTGHQASADRRRKLSRSDTRRGLPEHCVRGRRVRRQRLAGRCDDGFEQPALIRASMARAASGRSVLLMFPSACGDCVDTGSLPSVLVTAASLDRA
jgi:hypothetical protein